MITLMVIKAFLGRLWEWVVNNFWAALTVVLTIIVLFMVFCQRPKEDKIINIASPTGAVKEIQRERDENVNAVFNDIEQRRQPVPTPTPIKQKKNVNAQELEEIINGKK